MKYSREILIDLPRAEVIVKMEDRSSFNYWQRGFISYTHLSGTPGKEGSKARILLQIRARRVDMIETILKKNLPKTSYASYETKGVYNLQKNYFEKVLENQTRWIVDTEFHFSGFMKIIGTLKPGIFKNQTMQYMQDFKAFAEKGKSVPN
ncbi:hypothetical protein BH23BAC2_BH23BAC2_16430 [soil metagenome]